ncbi:MAG: energy transducer TonB [Culturomica sp.]|jgi:protein TonB|nr:energy transducer TonB [Culturomica sp.]
MEVKKSPKADLENKKVIYFETGLLVAVLLLFLSFEWKTDNSDTKMVEETAVVQIEDVVIPVTQQETPPPPPPPPAPKLTDLIDIVDNEDEVDDELEITDVDDEADNDVVDITDFTADEEKEDSEEVFVIVEKNPAFKGNMYKWIGDELRYPTVAQENGVEGRVFVNFVVEKDGSITAVKVTRGVDPSLDKEAIRVVKAMPKWTPGEQRGKPVRVSYSIPITFKLQH